MRLRTRTNSYCSITGKIAHGSAKKAGDHLVAIRSRRNKRYVGHVYCCPYCQAWHIGTPKPLPEAQALNKVERT